MGRMGTARRSYSASAADYKLLEEVGYGASATVYRAIYLPTNEIVAVKCLDLDRCSSNLDDIQREAQTMSLIDHPNVIRAFCSFVVERCLWVAMPFMAEGSCLHLMKIAYPDGFEESVIGSILKETLKALEYLHRHGHIHRDVKAGNILLDSGGVVKLGDFGVSACMFDRGDRQRSRTTFVGTPCWMAPEVLQPGSGYDFKADIWSFGITALELAHGHAPFSKYPPMKVLLMTIQNAPPGLDYDRDKRFSKSFKEMVAMCLVKDQTKRPTAEKLLKHSFFKNAKPPELSVKNLLTDLPPLWDRVKALQLKDAAQLALKKMPSAEQEALSQSEYKRGVSAWNFDVEDLKAQASLVQDGDDLIEMKDDDENLRLLVSDEDSFVSPSNLGKSMSTDVSFRGNRNCSEWLDDRSKIAAGEILETDLLNSSKRENSEKHEKDGSVNDPTPSSSDKDKGHNRCTNQVGKTRQTQSGPLVPASVLNHSSERERNAERREGDSQPATEKFRREVRKAPSFSGPLMLSNRASFNSLSAPIRSSGGYRDSMEDKSKANVVQIKGRFSVTSENVDLVKDIPLSSVSRRSSQVSPLKKSASVGDWQPDSRQLPNSKPTLAPTSSFVTRLSSLHTSHTTTMSVTSAIPAGHPKSNSLEIIGARQSLLSHFTSLQRPYNPFPIIASNRHIETIFASFFRSLPAVPLRRECLRTRDDGAVALDWVSGDDRRLPPESPLLILLPGLTGGSGDSYVRHMLVRARSRGWRVVVFNSRGCADSPVTTPQFYSASFTEDLRQVVKHIGSRYPKSSLYAIGWSLGANILVRYLGQESNTSPLSGAVSLCNPFDLVIADEDFHKGFNNIYDKALARALCKIFKKHALLFEGMEGEYNIPLAANAKSVREFDDGLTRVSFGYKSVDDYYFNSSSSHSIKDVCTPLLCIQAANDPIAPSRGIPRDDIKENPHCLLIVTPKGGHLGWVAGDEAPFGAPWTDAVVMEYLEHLEKQKTESKSCGQSDGVQQLEEAVLNVEV